MFRATVRNIQDVRRNDESSEDSSSTNPVKHFNSHHSHHKDSLPNLQKHDDSWNRKKSVSIYKISMSITSLSINYFAVNQLLRCQSNLARSHPLSNSFANFPVFILNLNQWRALLQWAPVVQGRISSVKRIRFRIMSPLTNVFSFFTCYPTEKQNVYFLFYSVLLSLPEPMIWRLLSHKCKRQNYPAKKSTTSIEKARNGLSNSLIYD